MEKLYTRDGKEIKLGTWEQEQLRKHPMESLPEDFRIHRQGRHSRDLKVNPMLYIAKPPKRKSYIVSLRAVGKGSKTFSFKAFGGEEAALAAAKKYRDKMVADMEGYK